MTHYIMIGDVSEVAREPVRKKQDRNYEGSRTRLVTKSEQIATAESQLREDKTVRKGRHFMSFHSPLDSSYTPKTFNK